MKKADADQSEKVGVGKGSVVIKSRGACGRTARWMMRTMGSRIGMVIAALTAVCLFAATSCGPRDETKTGKQEPLRIGAILPLTGDGSQYGQNVLDGIQLAVETVNKTGGIKGQRVEVLDEDSKTEARLAVSAINRLQARGVYAVIDDAVSTLTLAMVPTLKDAQTVLISTGASNPALSGCSPFFFRIWNSDAHEGKVAATFVASIPQDVSLAILHINNDYGKGLAEVLVRELRASRTKVVAVESFDALERNFRNHIEKIRSANASHIYLVGYAAQTGPATRQIREAGLRVVILGTVAMQDAEYLSLAADSAEGVIYPFPEDPTGQAVDLFRKAFRAKYGRDPAILNDCGYDAAMLLLSGFRAGAQKGENMRQFLTGVKNYQGASGTITFDTNGDVSKPMKIRTIRKGAFVDYTREGK